MRSRPDRTSYCEPGRSLAGLNSYGGRSPEYQNLRLLGLDRYRTFASRVDGSTSYLRFDGGLTWPAPHEIDDRRTAIEHMRRVGYAAKWVAPQEVARLTPGVDSSASSDLGFLSSETFGCPHLPARWAHVASTADR